MAASANTPLPRSTSAPATAGCAELRLHTHRVANRRSAAAPTTPGGRLAAAPRPALSGRGGMKPALAQEWRRPPPPPSPKTPGSPPLKETKWVMWPSGSAAAAAAAAAEAAAAALAAAAAAACAASTTRPSASITSPESSRGVSASKRTVHLHCGRKAKQRGHTQRLTRKAKGHTAFCHGALPLSVIPKPDSGFFLQLPRPSPCNPCAPLA